MAQGSRIHSSSKWLTCTIGVSSPECSPNQNGLETSMEKGVQAQRITTLSVFLTLPPPSSQSRGQESHRFCPCFWGRSRQWFCAKNLPRSNHKIPRPTTPTAMTGATFLPAIVSSPKVQRGWSFQAL